jgi:hypothetical protein
VEETEVPPSTELQIEIGKEGNMELATTIPNKYIESKEESQEIFEKITMSLSDSTNYPVDKENQFVDARQSLVGPEKNFQSEVPPTDINDAVSTEPPVETIVAITDTNEPPAPPPKLIVLIALSSFGNPTQRANQANKGKTSTIHTII